MYKHFRSYQKGTRRHQGQQGMCPQHYQTILVILSNPFLSKTVQGVAKTLPIFENNQEKYHLLMLLEYNPQLNTHSQYQFCLFPSQDYCKSAILEWDILA